MDVRKLMWAVLSAAIAGALVAGVFGLLVTERYVDRAIALEDARVATEQAAAGRPVCFAPSRRESAVGECW